MLKWIALLTLFLQAVWFGDITANTASYESQKYFGPLTSEEAQSIHYIISTLSSKSMISLLRYKKQLEIAGAKTKNVHPLRFWKEVLTNESLRSGLPNIGSIPRKQLLGDFSTAFASAQKNGLMKVAYMEDFCRATGTSPGVFHSYADRGDWNGLLATFFK